MVSPWMMHGTLPQYLEKMPGVDRLDMCIQISEGLSYLHHCSIAHGSLKGANILVSDDGVPALADFGESSLRDHSLSFTQTGTGPSFAVRWTAPEMLEGSITQPSKASDVYALGMTIYETVTGAVPYHGKREHAAIYLVVVQKKHPERPKVMLNDKTSADELWNLLVMCWSPEPPVRPSVSDVLEALKRIQAISRLSRKMDATEIISHLVAHGWVDLSNRLNLASFSGPPASHDGLGDIYRGQLLDGATVAVKLHQISIDRNNLGSKNMQRAIRELYMWSKCRHPNAMPLLGLAAFQEQIGVVVPWANNESLPQYLNVVLGVNRYHMCIQICEGLSYLHQIGIIHRNLKASNILVSRDGIPLLFDLGSSWLTNQTMDSTQSVKYSPESLRWTAPEVITETTSYNKNSDVYALGMTLYEVMAGKVPYYEQSDATITLLVVQKKEPPERPESIPEGHETTDGFWELLLCCWSFEPTARPSAADVMEAIKTLQAAVVLSRKMAAQEVISHLIARGCPDLSNRLNIASFGDYPIFQGGFSDVYRGQLLDGITVAVKVLRVSIDTITLGSKHLKQAARELDTWNQCRHPNIMPLLGLAVFRERIGMVAPWMKNGNLPKYLGATPGVDLYNMCIQICEGLSHLHRIQIVHCDLKGANVLVSDEGAPLLTDFGTSLVSERTLRFTATTSGTSYTLRWSPAEILQETSGHTQASDIYALGMVIYEVMTGKVPFHGKQDPKVILQVTSGEIPERLQCMPTGDRRADALWGLLGRCWSYKPEARPTAGEVMEALREIAE
ncbi:kinase-like domain-containing protein [Rhizoctonia solani]|nr:kinase-like domain-containing protein [Rhizoctonia solani]